MAGSGGDKQTRQSALDAAAFLIEMGADVCQRNRQLHSAVHVAVLARCYEFVELVLKKCASPSSSSSSPLLLSPSTLSGNRAASQPNIIPPSTSSAAQLSQAQQQQRQQQVQAVVDARGESALHYACRQNDMRMCDLLAAHGFEWTLKSDADKCPHEMCTDDAMRKVLEGRYILYLALNSSLLCVFLFNDKEITMFQQYRKVSGGGANSQP